MTVAGLLDDDGEGSLVDVHLCERDREFIIAGVAAFVKHRT